MNFPKTAHSKLREERVGPEERGASTKHNLNLLRSPHPSLAEPLLKDIIMFAVSASRRQLSTSHAPKLMIGSLFQRPRIPTCSSNPVFPNRYHIQEANNSKLNIVHEHSLKSRPDSQRFPLQPSFSSSSKKSTVIILMALMAGCYHQLSPPAAIRLDSEICPGAEPNQFLYNTRQSKQETTPQDIEAEKIHSLLSVRKLSFGTLTGICAGVFVKKGLTFLAFLCGGGFVLLQVGPSYPFSCSLGCISS
jgi:hypothetical protein